MSAQDLSTNIHDRVLAFASATAAGRRVPDLEAFLPAVGDPSRSSAVCELARVSIELRWRHGETPIVEDYFDRYPELTDPRDRALVAFEDYRQRLKLGTRPSRDEYRERFGVEVSNWPSPEAATAKAQQTSVAKPEPEQPPPETPTVQFQVRGICTAEDPNLATQRMRPLAKGAEIPDAGQVFGEFKLIRELGRGAFGRVFLAEQSDLSGREVALKIGASLTSEVRTLARLQHTNIVPVYSIHQVPPLSALCMPYFGGTTLSSVLSDLITSSDPASGSTFVESVERRKLENPKPVKEQSLPVSKSYFAAATYVESVSWIGERLADALAHAHERGIIHRDIKPPNILLADDGQPMLLDFNLAEDHNELGAERAQVGGTLPYMAPEQMRAFGNGPKNIDARVDIYGLGVVLYQFLVKRLPYPMHSGTTRSILPRLIEERSGPPPMLRHLNPEISPSLEAIVRKCLEPDASKRYPSAAALRDDLARQRTHQPLKHVVEPSYRERALKWKRRHPKLFSPAAWVTYSASILLIVSAIAIQQSLDARAKRQDAARLEAYHNYEELLTQADEVKLAAGSPEGSARVLDLGTAALQRYGATEPGWTERDEVTRLPMAEQERLKGEIGEVAFLTARAASLLKRDANWAEMLNSVARESLGTGAKSAAERQRSELTGLLSGEIEQAVGDGGRGDFLRASDLAARGLYREAMKLITGFVESHPDDFGGCFLKARCYDVLGQYEEARAAYSTCSALRPRSARPLAARGELAFRHGKDLDQAEVDLDRAIKLDPNLADARLNRALVRRALNRHEEALDDLNEVLRDENAPTRVYFLRAMVRESAGDKTGAAADREFGMKQSPKDPVSFITRGLARADADPEGALADFQAAEKLDPFNPDALINQAALLGEQMNRAEDAVAVVDRLLAIYPDHRNGRAGRAVLLARLGRADEAVAEARRLISRDPHPSVYYQVACVFAIAAKAKKEYREEAIKYVSLSLLRGFGHEYLLDDPDLDAVRGDSRFRRLFDGVKVMKEFELSK